jgi:putative transcriptional regulator
MEEVIAHSKGEKGEVRLFIPKQVDVRKVRERTGLTQNHFAATFSISLGTLRHWERADRKPHGPDLVLLNAVNNAPDILMRRLNQNTNQ